MRVVLGSLAIIPYFVFALGEFSQNGNATIRAAEARQAKRVMYDTN